MTDDMEVVIRWWGVNDGHLALPLTTVHRKLLSVDDREKGEGEMLGRRATTQQ